MGGFTYGQPTEESSAWRPIAIAAVLVIALGGLIFYLSRHKPAAKSEGMPIYGENLALSNLHLSTAENFAGGNVTYLEGKLTNTGNLTVTAAEFEIVFRNDLGEVVDKQTMPPLIAASPLGNPDWVPLNISPLTPGRVADFRFTFEHISADWNQGYPEIRAVNVRTK